MTTTNIHFLGSSRPELFLTDDNSVIKINNRCRDCGNFPSNRLLNRNKIGFLP